MTWFRSRRVGRIRITMRQQRWLTEALREAFGRAEAASARRAGEIAIREISCDGAVFHRIVAAGCLVRRYPFGPQSCAIRLACRHAQCAVLMSK